MNLADVRSCFPGTQGRVFLDAACISLAPGQAVEALNAFAQQMLLCTERDASSHHVAFDRTAGPARREIAKLIGAQPTDIALVESTTHALEIVAASVPLKCDDVILVGETEFLGLAVPWIPRQERDGFHIQIVPHRNGRLLVDDYAAAMTAQTRLLLLSSVQWNNGFRADLAAFSQIAQERGVLLVVDAIQQLGALPLDVGQTPVDFLVCGGHKWLNAPAGRGFLYVHPRRVAELMPPAWGYLNIQTPPEGWARYFGTPTIPAVRPYEFAKSARRFEVGGTSNYPGNVVLAASVALMNELGRDAIADHIRARCEVLIDGLRRAGATVVSPLGENERSSIVTFTLGQGPERDRACLEQLWDRRIVISERYTAGVGGLRTSVHFYNNDDDVRQLAEAVREIRTRGQGDKGTRENCPTS
jgi:cysteine desulfurase/selenocysteine lyase